MTEPANGFDNSAVYTMFHPPPPSNTSAAASASSPLSSSSSISGGAIAGAVIGSVAGAAAISCLVLWFCCVRRRRDRHRSENATAAAFLADEKVRQPPPAELSGQPAEVHEKPVDAAVELGLDGIAKGEVERKVVRPPPEGTGVGPQELDAVGSERNETVSNPK